LLKIGADSRLHLKPGRRAGFVAALAGFAAERLAGRRNDFAGGQPNALRLHKGRRHAFGRGGKNFARAFIIQANPKNPF
jgi:hypothetical protein